VKSWVGLTWIGAGGEEDAVIDKLMEKSAKLGISEQEKALSISRSLTKFDQLHSLKDIVKARIARLW
jgi:hypothetical protein